MANYFDLFGSIDKIWMVSSVSCRLFIRWSKSASQSFKDINLFFCSESIFFFFWRYVQNQFKKAYWCIFGCIILEHLLLNLIWWTWRIDVELLWLFSSSFILNTSFLFLQSSRIADKRFPGIGGNLKFLLLPLVVYEGTIGD